MPILLFSSTSFWFNTSGRLISGEINTLPNLQIIVLVPVMRMMTIHPACCVKLQDASVLRKNTASPHFLKMWFFWKPTQWRCGYGGWNAAWMYQLRLRLLRGPPADSLLELPQHSTHSYSHQHLHVKHVQVCLLLHIVNFFSARALSYTALPHPRPDNTRQALI